VKFKEWNQTFLLKKHALNNVGNGQLVGVNLIVSSANNMKYEKPIQYSTVKAAQEMADKKLALLKEVMEERQNKQSSEKKE
jgi:hypothetical protein